MRRVPKTYEIGEARPEVACDGHLTGDVGHEVAANATYGYARKRKSVSGDPLLGFARRPLYGQFGAVRSHSAKIEI
jgi:hypothetical protein